MKSIFCKEFLYGIILVSIVCFWLAYILDSLPYSKEPYANKAMNYGSAQESNTPTPPSTTNIYSGTSNSVDTKPTDNSINASPESKYDSDNYNVQYHTDPSLNTDSLAPENGTWVNQNGSIVFIDWKNQPSYVTYYTSGAYPYGASSYVPTYEESVYLSKTTGQSTLGNPYPSATTLKGFCENNPPGSVEQMCGALSPDQCASTSCCVLLGGNKCVSGDETGPRFQANYSDPSIVNKDVYYYRGKCYGNCDNTNPSSTPYLREPPNKVST
jgi:hypothetical protein